MDPLASAEVHMLTLVPRIFLCYRRDDSSAYAGRLFEMLAAEFGADQVFMDTASITPGEDWASVIVRRVAASDVLLAVIGTRWLLPNDARRQAHLFNPNDNVRLEIVTALSC